jgi:hypothetical protein
VADVGLESSAGEADGSLEVSLEEEAGYFVIDISERILRSFCDWIDPMV